jgi:hypothetical protein
MSAQRAVVIKHPAARVFQTVSKPDGRIRGSANVRVSR